MQTIKKIRITNPNPKTSHEGGFTLLELVMVAGLLGLLLATLLPAMARSGPNSRTLQCSNNLRQLATAWRLYADDNRDIMVCASDNGPTASGPYAWTTGGLDYNPANHSNWDVSVDLAKGPLWSYGGRTGSIYKCPTDESYVVVNGVAKPRVRSISMNFFLGGFAGTDGGIASADAYRLFFKTTDLTSPGPAATFIFLDMREDSINVGNFLTDMAGYPNTPAAYGLYDIPNNLHDSAGNFVFGDGHTETHRWLDTRTTPPFTPGINFFDHRSSPGNLDVAWLQRHSTAPR